MADPIPSRVALVLGSGGILGGAFHAGVLKALLDTWDIDARRVDLVVGTSAGSVAGSLTAAGLHPNDLFRRETGQALSPSGHRLLTKARSKRSPTPETTSAFGRPVAPEALFQAMLKPSGVAFGSLMAALMPRGRAPTAHIAALIDGLFGSEWPDSPELRICAVDVTTAKRVVFGAGGVAAPSEAVAASCAVPAVFAPVTINGREYLDGGVHSADNVDVIGDTAYDLVVVSSPIGSRKATDIDPTWGALRTISRWQTQQQVRALSGSRHIEIVRPDAKSLDAMGPNLLDTKRRPAVALQAHASASAQFARTGNPV